MGAKRKNKHTSPRKKATSPLPPSKKSMEILLRRSGLKVTNKKLTLLWKYHTLLRRHNEEYDLTRLHRFETMVIKHYVDSLYIRTLVKLASPLLDLGTGAGLPGIPLKIFTPSLSIILAEKRKKRVEFLRIVVEELGLEDIHIHPHSVGKSLAMPVEGLISRAVESMEKTLKRAAGFLPVGGKVYFMKGPHYQEELEKALKIHKNSFELEEEISYTLPHTPYDRALLVFRKKQS